MAAALLKQLGEKALHPVKVGDIWHKAAISAKNLAKERRIALLEGRPWEFDQETAGQTRGYRRKLKGHKHDKLAAARFAVIALSSCLVQADETPRQAEREHFCLASRQEDIKKNLEGMDARIQAYRDSRKLKEASILDQLLMTPKQRRFKQFRETK